MKKIVKKYLLSVVIASVFLLPLSAQTMGDAITAYNEGASLLKTEPEKAIESLQKSIEISEQVGPEAADTKEMAQNMLPKAYYQLGVNAYQAKDYEDAAGKFMKAAEIAENTGDTDVMLKAQKNAAQLYNSIGAAQLKKENYEGAAEYFQNAVQTYPTFFSGYNNLLAVYFKTEDSDNAIIAADTAIFYATQNNDAKEIREFTDKIQNHLLNRAKQARQQKDYDAVLGFTESALKYDQESVEAYYLLASAYNELSQWQKAEEAANKALELEEDVETDEAGLYYELGRAYAGMGNKSEACNAFTNAAYGNFKANAEYQMEHILECK